LVYHLQIFDGPHDHTNNCSGLGLRNILPPSGRAPSLALIRSRNLPLDSTEEIAIRNGISVFILLPPLSEEEKLITAT